MLHYPVQSPLRPRSPIARCYLSSILPLVFFHPAAPLLTLNLILGRGPRHPVSASFYREGELAASYLRYGEIMQRRRRWLSRCTTDAFLRRRRDVLYPLRDASCFTPRSVSRVDKATAGSSRSLHLPDNCAEKCP